MTRRRNICYPKEPPTYIAFRYAGKLQSTHRIENWTTVTNLHSEIPEVESRRLKVPYFVYKLSKPFLPAREVPSGKLRDTRLSVRLDTLFTCRTIVDASKETQKRERHLERNGW